MKKTLRTISAGLLLALTLTASIAYPAVEERSLVDWQDWSAAAFEQAARENKAVLLNLEAVWCHWCHVMDQKTYSDASVAAIIREHYIPVKVDHDARPDLANRYRDFGWPATIVLNSDGEDIAKRAGFIGPQKFSQLLRAIVADPSPENRSRQRVVENYATSAFLDEELQRELLAAHYSSFDWDLGGFRSKKKSMDRNSTEYSLSRAAKGDEREERMSRLTIDASMALIDPAWGGVYQYSTRGNWANPHFEKIMATQAGYLRIYSLAFLQWQEPRYLRAALDTEKYLAEFLTSPNGAFYTSQDADLIQGEKGTTYFALPAAERRARGMPRVDKNIYARENGWAIEAVATLYQATGDDVMLNKATRAAEWIIANRSLPNGGYSHSESDNGGPYLADTLNMGRAFLQLYTVTGERRWLQSATAAAKFIDASFRQEKAGFLSGAAIVGTVVARPNIDENVSTTRFLNLVAHHTGDAEIRAAAEHGMRYLATREVATQRREEGGVLLAGLELSSDPAHLTIVGPKRSSSSRALFDVALRKPGWYKRVEWWDVAEGPLPNPDVQYPTFDRAAAFVCADGRCSIPAFAASEYWDLIVRLSER